MNTDLTTLCASLENSIRQAIAQMEANQAGIVLVVNAESKLLATVTDGDVRRAILANISLDEPLSALLAQKEGTRYAMPITAPADASHDALLGVLLQHKIAHLPLVDQDQTVVALVTLDEFMPGEPLPLQAVIMAGGFGTRLRPLTEDLPKPMLPVGDKPLMERIIDQLREAGIRRVNVTTHFKPEAITKHFGDGERFGVEISYTNEDEPMGTAGAISQLQVIDEPLLVVNGDIVTNVDFRAMLDFHKEHQAEMTVAVTQHELQIPYGVIESDGVDVTGISEKPVIRHFVNAGMYLLSPDVCARIPNDKPFDMPDLIVDLVKDNLRVVSFPVHEYWIDIGRYSDYRQAQEQVSNEEMASNQES